MNMSRKKAVLDYLNKLNIPYERFDHEAAFTIEECQKIKEAKGWVLCKNLLLRTTSGAEHWLLVMKSDKSFVTREISKKLGSSRLSFASGGEMEVLLNTSPGSLSILSLVFDKEKAVNFAIDSELLEDEYLFCHPCDNTSTLKIKTSDITEKLLPSLGIETKIITV